ncbi:MAG: hypothetical protein K9H58_14730 [Bacteroidales bacterium]|nr:hypothetical protein [Bacteroidales bacterium]
MSSRRSFIKQVSIIAGATALVFKTGKPVGAVPGPNSTLDDTDYPVINTTNNLENITVREVRDPSVQLSTVGNTLITYLNDSIGDAVGWEYLGKSDNLSDINIDVSGNILYSTDAIPASLAEQFYEIDYRGRNYPFDKPAGMTYTLKDQIDRYKTDLTITYEVNGNTETVQVNIPNVVAKQIFGWDPDEPIPWEEYSAYDRVNNPVEFETAMNNLYQILEANGLEADILKNRNTGLPPLPDPNPWYTTKQLLEDLAEDPMSIDDLYPTVISLQMTDYGK